MVAHIFDSSAQKAEAGDLHKSEAQLVYIARSSRSILSKLTL